MTPGKIEKFIEEGWIIIDIPEPGIIQEQAEALEKKSREIIGTDCSLAKLHEYVDEESYRNLYAALSEYFWENEFSLKAGKAFMPVLKELIGLDIMVQYRPYLRMARPEKTQDNIGYHRDTQYGQTPYELAVHIPFVDLDENSSLRVISGSHILPESAFPIIEGVETTVTKGSLDHKMGKPYSPRRMPLPDGMKTEPLSMRVGQAALFSPAIFHGQELNQGNVTRVTTDVRFVNSNADVELRLGKVHAGYVPVTKSPVQQAADLYYQAQKQDKAKRKTA